MPGGRTSYPVIALLSCYLSEYSCIQQEAQRIFYQMNDQIFYIIILSATVAVQIQVNRRDQSGMVAYRFNRKNM